MRFPFALCLAFALVVLVAGQGARFDPCSVNADCLSDYCQLRTCYEAPAGVTCSSDQQCGSRSCVAGKCAQSADGGTCFVDDDCQSFFCNGAACALSAGKSCTSDDQCASQHCLAGACTKISWYFGPGPPAKFCGTNSDCLSNSCVKDGTACDDQNLRCRDQFTCGKGAVGIPCFSNNDCGSNRCGPLRAATGLGTCTSESPAYVLPGQPCVGNNDCGSFNCAAGLCQSSRAGFECQVSKDCDSGQCDPPLTPGYSFGQCAAPAPTPSPSPSPAPTPEPGRKPLGAHCSKSSQCLSGFCSSSHCALPAADGESCSKDAGCRSKRCDQASHLCGFINRKNGAVCSKSSECRSGNCQHSRCHIKLPKGGKCYKAANCRSGACKSGKCA